MIVAVQQKTRIKERSRVSHSAQSWVPTTIHGSGNNKIVDVVVCSGEQDQ